MNVIVLHCPSRAMTWIGYSLINMCRFSWHSRPWLERESRFVINLSNNSIFRQSKSKKFSSNPRESKFSIQIIFYTFFFFSRSRRLQENFEVRFSHFRVILYGKGAWFSRNRKVLLFTLISSAVDVKIEQAWNKKEVGNLDNFISILQCWCFVPRVQMFLELKKVPIVTAFLAPLVLTCKISSIGFPTRLTLNWRRYDSELDWKSLFLKKVIFTY